MIDLAAEAALLRSSDSAGLLAAALTGGNEPTLRDFVAELTTWQYRPGAEVTAGFHVSYRTPGGDRVLEHLFATTADAGAPAAEVARGDLRFSVWRHPDDPRLPALAAACDPGQVLDWVTSPGTSPPAELDVTLLGYRPLRRAVLRVSADGRRSYLKVLRPERAGRLVRRQQLLSDAGLTPALHSEPAPGVLLTPEAPGQPLSALLADPTRALPPPALLVDLLDRLPAAVCDLERRPSWSDRLDFHAATATERLPGQAERVRDVAGRVAGALASAPVGPVRPTHGDFYEANVVVDPGGAMSVVDLDAVGPGLREDDLACLLAHLSVLPELSPDDYRRVPEVLTIWTEDFAARVHPAALAARVAAVLLSLVAGGTDGQAEHRLELADEWATRALDDLA